MKTSGTLICSKNFPADELVNTLTSCPSTSTFISAVFDRISGNRSLRRMVFIGDRVLQYWPMGVRLHFVVFIRNTTAWFFGSTPIWNIPRTFDTALCTRVTLELTAPRSMALANRDIECQLGSTARTCVTRAAGNDHNPTLAPMSTNCSRWSRRSSRINRLMAAFSWYCPRNSKTVTG